MSKTARLVLLCAGNHETRAFLFQTCVQEQMIYMWNVLTAIFFTQVLMVIGYCAALACLPRTSGGPALCASASRSRTSPSRTFTLITTSCTEPLSRCTSGSASLLTPLRTFFFALGGVCPGAQQALHLNLDPDPNDFAPDSACIVVPFTRFAVLNISVVGRSPESWGNPGIMPRPLTC